MHYHILVHPVYSLFVGTCMNHDVWWLIWEGVYILFRAVGRRLISPILEHRQF
ncbi:hypothetical protein HOLleu_23251 [Holothuria leucospilota]|uniref:Uncharacterized protein n=1 Tax=Holothuria leucospilota TaxID=206669 RepID=A0A9Q1BBG4_HOLLE|nr:hypothetical protein HOLleu_39048 [Holothuria leucospilota]KAJ8033111.1 hypothetical protein HOLleu_23251 [Holothuria leucospilota]